MLTPFLAGSAIAQSRPQPAAGDASGAAMGPVQVSGAVSSPFLGSVRKGEITDAPLALTLDAAIARGLETNLGALLADAGVQAASGRRAEALAELLPNARGRLAAEREQINLAAFGFAPPGIPQLIGPFNVFDARLAVSQTVLDLSALARERSQTRLLNAARYTAADARGLVALVVTDLYLQAVTAASRLESGQAELKTSRTLHQLAVDRRESGVVAGIEVLRAQVQLESTEQRVIVLENELEKDRLAVARVIGLPLGQPFTLADALAFRALPPMTADAAFARALDQRSDLLAAGARVAAAESAVAAARRAHLPTLRVTADVGAIGNTVSGALPTFAMAAGVDVPLFESGAIRGRVETAAADLRRAQAERDDLRGRVEYDVRAALLDVQAAERRVAVAQHTRELAATQQAQAEDRFRAGVASNLELVQAQEAVAAANDTLSASIFAHNAAKAALARGIGIPEAGFRRFVTGETR